MDSTSIASDAQHLCVLVHGFWGNPNHLEVMARFLREKHPINKFHILIAKRNSGNQTYDGIELGGERVCQEIEDEIERLNRSGNPIKRLSLVGYSLGGLFARYAVGLLSSKGFFEHIQPVNFTTFVTPHLGVRAPLKRWQNTMWNIFGARTLLTSGRQLFMIDKFRDTGKPLLEILAEPDSIFIQGLAKFQRRTLYTNIINDRSAVYYTTSISSTDPFKNLEKINISYLKGYDNVILDPETPIGPVGPEESDSFSARLLRDSETTLRRLPFLLALVTYMPIGLIMVVIKSGVHSLGSNRRIQRYNQGLTEVKPSNYRVPLIINIQGAIEDVYENVNSAQSHEYLAEGTGSGPRSEGGQDSTQPSDQRLGDLEAHNQNFPILALGESQFKMIQTLNNLGWRKYPVHIHNNRHSHAAIIVRVDKPNFDEGRVVLHHWVDEEFIL